MNLRSTCGHCVKQFVITVILRLIHYVHTAAEPLHGRFTPIVGLTVYKIIFENGVANLAHIVVDNYLSACGSVVGRSHDKIIIVGGIQVPFGISCG